MLAVEQVAEEQRDADVAGEERVAAAAELGTPPLDLGDCVHGEGAGPVEPEPVFRPVVEDEECVRVPGRAVAEARSLREGPSAPRQFAAREGELLVHDVA